MLNLVGSFILNLKKETAIVQKVIEISTPTRIAQNDFYNLLIMWSFSMQESLNPKKNTCLWRMIFKKKWFGIKKARSNTGYSHPIQLIGGTYIACSSTRDLDTKMPNQIMFRKAGHSRHGAGAKHIWSD